MRGCGDPERAKKQGYGGSITTVSKVRLINIMGTLSPSDLSAVELAVKIQLLL